MILSCHRVSTIRFPSLGVAVGGGGGEGRAWGKEHPELPCLGNQSAEVALLGYPISRMGHFYVVEEYYRRDTIIFF